MQRINLVFGKLENEEVHGFASNHLESFCWRYFDNNDTSDHTRVCGSLKASLLTHPTQAIMAAPGARPVIAGSYPHDRAGFGLSSRKGPDLGGGKVVSVTETVTISGELENCCFRESVIVERLVRWKIAAMTVAFCSLCSQSAGFVGVQLALLRSS